MENESTDDIRDMLASCWLLRLFDTCDEAITILEQRGETSRITREMVQRARENRS